METWILSIVGVICLGVLLEIVLPEGQTTKYVKGTFALLVIFVIAAPLPTFLGADWKFNFDKGAFDVDSAFVEETVDLQAKAIAGSIKEYLALNGYDAEVTVQLEENSLNKIKRATVIIALDDKQIISPSEHTDKVRELVQTKFKIKDSVLFIGTDKESPPK